MQGRNLPLMLTFLREQSKWMMILFFTLLFFSFALFFNISALDVLRPTQAGKIDGKKYNYEDFKTAFLGTSLWYQIESGGQSPDNENSRSQLMRMTWIHLALLAEAQNAGVQVSDQEVIDFIKKLPFFQKEGKYQAEYYQQFVRGFLGSQGISSTRFEQIVREQLIVDQFRLSLIGSIKVPAQESLSLFNKMMGPVKFSVVRLPLITTGFTASPEEIQKEYDNRKSDPALMHEELRQVAFASFRFTPAELKLPEKERSEVKARLAEKAQNLSTQLYTAHDSTQFATVAAAAGAIAGKTEFFSPSGSATPLPPSVHFNRAAFRLSKEDSVSSAVELEDGFYVLQLLDSKPATLKSLAEVTPILQKIISDRKAAEALRTQGEALALKLHDAVKSGASFKAAATALKLTVQEIPEFKPAEPNQKDPDANLWSYLSQDLQEGQVSGFKPSSSGGIIASFDSRKPGNIEEFKKIQPMIESRLLNSYQSRALNDFIKGLSKTSRYHFPDEVLGSKNAE